MLRSTRVLRDVCSGAYVPGAGDPGFSKIIEGPSGPGCAPGRLAGGACHGSAAIRRQAYTARGGVFGAVPSVRMFRGAPGSDLLAGAGPAGRRSGRMFLTSYSGGGTLTP